MSGGRKDRKKEFQQNPFKRLKGFCVSPPADQPVTSPEVQPVQDEATLFAEEMELLGVTQTTPDEEGKRPSGSSPALAVEPPTDRELFLASLGEMEAVFADEIPAEEEPAAVPRRMRQLRRGELVPEAQLDLHGLRRADARQRVRHFLDNAAFHGRKVVLIVTGRGKSSGGEPVLRAEIERYLRHEAAAWVAEWGRAPARYGGEGALVVFLKRRQGSE